MVGSTLLPIFTKDFPVINSSHLTTTENFTDIYFSLLTRHFDSKKHNFDPFTFIWMNMEFLFCQNSFLIWSYLNSFILVLPLNTLIKLLCSTKLIRDLLCIKALRAQQFSTWSAKSFLISTASPRTHLLLTVPMSTSSQRMMPQLYISGIKLTNRWGQKKGNSVQWPPIKSDEIGSWNSPIFMMFPDFNQDTWG